MKAITILQPRAALIAVKAIRFDTRTWYTHYRGPVAIHAALEFPDSAQRLCRQPAYAEALCGTAPSSLPTGCIIAFARLHAIYPTSRSGQQAFGFLDIEFTEQEMAFGDFSPNRHAWHFTDIRALDNPIPCLGARSLWEWNEEMINL